MILFLYGNDNYRSKEQLHKMIAKFRLDRDPQGFNTARLDMHSVSLGRALEEVFAIPFLSEKRMVVIENLLVSKNKDAQEAFLKKINEQTIPESSIVIFWEQGDTFKTKSSKALFDRLVQEKYAQHFEELTGKNLESWIVGALKEMSADISQGALSLLITSVGANMWQLSNILEQLVAFADGEQISISHVKSFVTEHADDNIFNLVDAIISKQAKPMFKMLQQQYAIGKDAGFVVAMLIRQFNLLLQMRDLFEREENISSTDMAKRTGAHPFAVKKSFVLVKKVTLKELQKAYAELLQIDLETKTGQQDQRVSLDLFIAEYQLRTV